MLTIPSVDNLNSRKLLVRCNMVRSLCQSTLRCLKKLRQQHDHIDYAIQMRAYVHIEKSVQLFLAVLFVISLNWKQPKCPWRRGKNLVVYLYNWILISYKKNKLLMNECRNIDEPQIYHAEWKKLNKTKNTYFRIYFKNPLFVY